MNRVGIAVAFGQRGENDHSDGAIAVVGAFVPGNKKRAMILEGCRSQDLGHFGRQPVVTVPTRGDATAQIMHVVTDVWRNEVVTGYGVILEVSGQFGVRTNMGDGVGAVRGDIVKVDKWVMANGVGTAIDHGDVSPGYIFLVSAPGNAGS